MTARRAADDGSRMVGGAALGWLLLAAVVLGIATFVAAAAVDLGCIGGVIVACYGPNPVDPTAPGWWPGTILEAVALVIVIVVVLVSFVGICGLRMARRRSWWQLGWVLLLASIVATVIGAGLLHAAPSDVFCRRLDEVNQRVEDGNLQQYPEGVSLEDCENN